MKNPVVAETVNMQSENEEEVELPTRLLKRRANSQSKSLPQTKKPGGRSERGDGKLPLCWLCAKSCVNFWA